MNAECGKDFAGDAARKGFRAERTRVRAGKDCGPSGRECRPERIPGRAIRFGGRGDGQSALPTPIRGSAGRRPASSGRLGGALTCPTCWPSGGGLASSWMPNAERIPQGMRPGKDCGPSGLGLFGRRELLRCWLLALGRRGLVFSFQRAGKGAFSNQRSVVGQTRDRTRGVLRNGRVERSGWRQVGALLRRGNLAGL